MTLIMRDSKEGRERAAHMLALREEGKTLEEVGEIYGLTRERVRQITREEGQRMRVKSPVVRKRQEARRELLQEGAAMNRELGLQAKSGQNHPDEELLVKVREAVESGLTGEKAAKELGISKMTFWRYKKRLGLQVKRKKKGRLPDFKMIDKAELLMDEGMSNGKIAMRLQINHNTVLRYRERITQAREYERAHLHEHVVSSRSSPIAQEKAVATGPGLVV